MELSGDKLRRASEEAKKKETAYNMIARDADARKTGPATRLYRDPDTQMTDKELGSVSQKAWSIANRKRTQWHKFKEGAKDADRRDFIKGVNASTRGKRNSLF